MLIKCPECGKQISDKAFACPDCGCPVEHNNIMNDIPVEEVYYKKLEQSVSKKKEKENEKKKKKRTGLWILLFILFFGGCGSCLAEVETEETTELNNNNEATVSEEVVTVDEKISVDKEVFIEEQEIYNDKGISITAKDIVVENSSTVINFTINNSSTLDYAIAAHSYSINKLMAGANLYGFSSIDVPTGKNAKLSVEIDNEYIVDNFEGKIEELEFIFWVYGDSMKEFDTGILQITTNLYKENGGYQVVGTEVYSDDRITLWRVDKYKFVVLNKSEYTCGYTIENCSINDWSYDITSYTYDLYDTPIHKNSFSLFEIPIETEFLEENSIDNINNIEFNVILEDSYWNFQGPIWKHKSDKINISF